MAVVAFGNLKGGVGKSTLAVNVACALARKHRVILLDADSQGTALMWSSYGRLPITVEALPLEVPRDAKQWTERVLSHGATYDVVVIDLPPHLSAAAHAAFLAADLVAVPISASAADMMSTSIALDLLREARAVRRNGKPDALFVPSRIDRRTAAGREFEGALREVFKDTPEDIGPAVGQRSAFVDSLTVGEWVGKFAPGSKALAEVVALADALRRRF